MVGTTDATTGQAVSAFVILRADGHDPVATAATLKALLGGQDPLTVDPATNATPAALFLMKALDNAVAAVKTVGVEVPVIVLVHGEGGSGGALGIAVGDRILMHEFAIYSVIPPEGCAAILWRDSGRKMEAAEAQFSYAMGWWSRAATQAMTLNGELLKAQAEVDADALKNGEGAALEVGVTGIPMELLRILGRLQWRTSFGQNVLLHSIETAQVAGTIAGELGMDIRAAKVGGLLHDIGKALDHEIEGTHAAIGADLAKRHGMPDSIVNAIAAHHEQVEPICPESVLVAAAEAPVAIFLLIREM